MTEAGETVAGLMVTDTAPVPLAVSLKVTLSPKTKLVRLPLLFNFLQPFGVRSPCFQAFRGQMRNFDRRGVRFHIEVIHTPGHCAAQLALPWHPGGMLFAAPMCG